MINIIYRNNMLKERLTLTEKIFRDRDNRHQNQVTRIMLFDLVTGGHHASYIQHILNFLCQESVDIHLDIVVSPSFFEIHRDTIDIISSRHRHDIQFIPITQTEYLELESQTNSWKRIWGEWKILCQYAENLGSHHILLMMFDYFQLPLFFSRQLPCSISGIYFRPTFHYYQFPHYSPSFKEKIRQIRQKFILRLVLKHPQIKNIFCLDEFAIGDIQKISKYARVFYLPDPVKIYENQEEIANIKLAAVDKRKSLNIQPKQTVFLLFGHLDRRKGIHQVLEAIRLLPKKVTEKICLLLVGKIAVDEREKIISEINHLSTSSPAQIITYCEYIPEQEVPVYFQIADVILTPHQQHVGMSGTILLAAAAQKPVLASNYGLVGHLVKIHQLGMTVDTQSSYAIADAMTKFIETNPAKFYDSKKMQQFAEQHSYMEFAKILINNLLLD